MSEITMSELAAQVAELKADVDAYSRIASKLDHEVEVFKSSNGSRRGLDGGRGIQGEPGPEGRPGKDGLQREEVLRIVAAVLRDEAFVEAFVQSVVTQATRQFHADMVTFYQKLSANPLHPGAGSQCVM